MNWGDDWWWVAIGLGGQAAFSSRMLVQWIASERAGRSYVPILFWYLSLCGSLTLFVYAIHRQEPIFALGQAFGWIVYGRNLILLHRTGETESPSGHPNEPHEPVEPPRD